MLKKNLINNAIALLAYGLSSVATLVICSFLLDRTENLYIFTVCIAAFLYVLCGFLLRPAKKLSFLSVVSIPIALIILLLICMQLGEAAVLYYFLNPIAMPLIDSYLLRIPRIVFQISPLYPYLFFYLGILLRKLYSYLKYPRKRREAKGVQGRGEDAHQQQHEISRAI